jgi:predicted dehydrogenase
VRKLRLGVIGAGAWTVASHLPNLQRRREVEFLAVNRRDPLLLERIRRRFGFAQANTDYRDVLALGPDICVVGSPVKWHHEHAKAALEAGAHVLVEKPFTLDPAEAWDLVSVADRVGRHLLISLGWHYKPIVRKAKALMENGGGIGQAEQVSVVMASTTREVLSGTILPFAPDQSASKDFVMERAEGTPHELVPRTETMTDPAVSGGGYAQAQLSHAVGLALWLTALSGSAVFAYMAPAGADVELHDAISIRFRGGAIGTVSGGSSHLGAGHNKHQLDLRIIGSGGQLHLDLERERLWRYRGAADDVRVRPAHNAGLYDCRGPIDALVDLALGRDVPNASPAELGARTVEIVHAAYRSARTGTPASITAAAPSGAGA